MTADRLLIPFHIQCQAAPQAKPLHMALVPFFGDDRQQFNAVPIALCKTLHNAGAETEIAVDLERRAGVVKIFNYALFKIKTDIFGGKCRFMQSGIHANKPNTAPAGVSAAILETGVDDFFAAA